MKSISFEIIKFLFIIFGIFSSDFQAFMIARAGYNAQSFIVPTEDGYLLTLDRILPKGTGEHHPVLLQHGLLSSAADWLILGKGKSLGNFYLKFKNSIKFCLIFLSVPLG